MRKIYFYCLFLLTFQIVNSQIKDTIINSTEFQSYSVSDTEIYTYKKTRFFDMLNRLPKDFVGTLHDVGKKNNLIAVGASAVATLAILPADQYLLEKSRPIGEKLGLKEVARYNSFGPITIIPPNATSAIYLIGNGSTTIMLGMGFATFGLIKNDFRALNTASELIESLAISGVYSQTIKRISGRQSPDPAKRDGNPGGDWNPFPSFKAFATHTPNYDAFPSGHVMTATSALYVIMGNYPEKKWIRPVGFSLIGILGFEMVQANVHWVSDYPIALVMGYIIGKNLAKSRVEKTSKSMAVKEKKKKYILNYDASRSGGFNLIGANLTF